MTVKVYRKIRKRLEDVGVSSKFSPLTKGMEQLERWLD